MVYKYIRDIYQKQNSKCCDLDFGILGVRKLKEKKPIFWFYFFIAILSSPFWDLYINSEFQ